MVFCRLLHCTMPLGADCSLFYVHNQHQSAWLAGWLAAVDQLMFSSLVRASLTVKWQWELGSRLLATCCWWCCRRLSISVCCGWRCCCFFSSCSLIFSRLLFPTKEAANGFGPHLPTARDVRFTVA